MPHKAYFVIADITGYTAFLTGSELEHAQDILKHLFNSLLDNIKPPLIISNFQGDAILSYAPDGSFIQGQTLLEVIENTYIEFIRTLENMHHNTTCTCRACANIPKLDLKLFVHYGEYVIQDMRGKAELSGPDVIIAHRMMKNEVKEKTGLKAYTLFTEAAVNGLGLQEFTCEMKPHSETYDHIGEVKMFAYCLKTMWEREREKRRVFVDRKEASLIVEADLPAPPALVWDYLNEPQHKKRWLEVEDVKLSKLQNGRQGAGSMNHCYHGKDATSDFVILDWRPFEYVTMDIQLPMHMMGRFTTRLTPAEGGTRVAFIFSRQWGVNAVGSVLARLMAPMMKKELQKSFTRCGEVLCQMITEDSAAGNIALRPDAAAV
jgi:uncharacterized protein YndB with AHSA1/START domain